MEKPSGRLDRWFPWLFSASALVAIAATAYLFLYTGSYDFVVETACDPATEQCFYRDCSEEDACPPNGLEHYRMFTVAASDFPVCSDNSCLTECASGALVCTEIVCGESEEDECAVLEEPERVPEEGELREDDSSS